MFRLILKKQPITQIIPKTKQQKSYQITSIGYKTDDGSVFYTAYADDIQDIKESA